MVEEAANGLVGVGRLGDVHGTRVSSGVDHLMDKPKKRYLMLVDILQTCMRTSVQ